MNTTEYLLNMQEKLFGKGTTLPNAMQQVWETLVGSAEPTWRWLPLDDFYEATLEFFKLKKEHWGQSGSKYEFGMLLMLEDLITRLDAVSEVRKKQELENK